MLTQSNRFNNLYPFLEDWKHSVLENGEQNFEDFGRYLLTEFVDELPIYFSLNENGKTVHVLVISENSNNLLNELICAFMRKRDVLILNKNGEWDFYSYNKYEKEWDIKYSIL